MTIGDVFMRAWDLWRRDVGWLILAGLVVGLVLAVVALIAGGVLGALLAGAGVSIGADLANGSASSLSEVGAGLLLGGIIVYVVMLFLLDVLALTFYGGLFEMVIGAYREQRGVEFADLFSGFRRFGAYAVFALVMIGINLGLSLLSVIPFLGGLIALVISVWVWIIWLYVLPLMADQGLGFGDAAGASHRMVKGAGWWWTFGMICLLALAAIAAVVVIVALALAVGKADTAGGIAVGTALGIVLAVLFPPYAICYLCVLYVASGGDQATAPAGGGMSLPPAPSAPPAYGTLAPSAPPAYSTPASTTAIGPVAPAGVDAWRMAADPLAAAPPSPPPMAQTQGAASAAVAETTTATRALEAEAPQAPEPPTPPPSTAGF